MQHVATISWSRSGESISDSVTVSGESEQNFDVTVPGSGNVVIASEIDVSALNLVYITLDGTSGHSITLTTNDDGTPDDSFTISVDKPLLWYTGCGLPNPFASGTDVESFKATKATSVNATLKMRFLFSDVTT